MWFLKKKKTAEICVLRLSFIILLNYKNPVESDLCSSQLVCESGVFLIQSFQFFVKLKEKV